MSFKRAAPLGQDEKTAPQALTLKKGVRGLFLADGRAPAVARPNFSCIRQHQKFLPDPAQKQIPIAAGQIPPPDPTTKEHVTAHNHGILRRMKAQTAGAMARDIEDIKLPPKKILPRAPSHDAVGLDRSHPQGKSLTLEKVFLGNHRNGVRMADHRTPVTRLDRGGIRHMVPVAVGQDEQVDFLAGEPLIRPLRSVKKDAPPRRLHQKAVGREGAAGKSFELKHGSGVEVTCLIFLAQCPSRGDQLLRLS